MSLHVGPTKGTMDDMATETNKNKYNYSKRKEKFVKHFNNVLDIAKKNGRISLPRNNHETRLLANFLDNQKRRKYLPNDERKMLEALKPFGYNINERINHQAVWDDFFQQIVDHKEGVGHLRVSRTDPTTRKLSRWVNQQRQNEKDNILSEDRKKRLLDIGFVFRCAKCCEQSERYTNDQEELWNKRFGNLVRYKEKYGNCNVPFTYEDDPVLANWVSVQRGVFQKGKMDESRRRRLEDIGFTWSLKKNHKSE